MATDNHVNFAGNLTRDPELKFTKSGQAVVNIGVAVNESYKDDNDEWQSRPNFVDVTAWGDLAENVAESLQKGDRVTVSGKLKQESWETDEGDKRSKIAFVADDVSASLKWALVNIEKPERDSKPAARSSNRSSGRSGSSGSSRGGGRSRREEPDYDDEEPF